MHGNNEKYCSFLYSIDLDVHIEHIALRNQI
jgi:hypothetical protein